MSEKIDIGELYKKTVLADSEDPGELAWDTVAKELTKNNFYKFTLTKLNIYYVSLLSSIVVLVGIYYFTKPKKAIEGKTLIHLDSTSISSKIDSSNLINKSINSANPVSSKQIDRSVLLQEDKTPLTIKQTPLSKELITTDSEKKPSSIDSIVTQKNPSSSLPKTPIIIIQKDTIVEMDTINYKKKRQLKKIVKDQTQKK